MKKHSPRKPYRPRPTKPSLFEVREAFLPLDLLLDQLDTGLVDVAMIEGRETAYFVEQTSGDRYPAAPCLRCWIACFEMFQRRMQTEIDLWPLQKLANKLDYGVLLTSTEVAAARATVEQQRALYRRIPLDIIRDCAMTEMISVEMDRIRREAA